MAGPTGENSKRIDRFVGIVVAVLILAWLIAFATVWIMQTWR
jgi:hypothetical protein